MEKGSVLLTGVSGFLGSHTAIQLLEKGYKVIGTLRSIERSISIKETIAKHTSNIENLRFVEAELRDEDVWMKLMSGIDYVQHIASPFPRELPKHEDELIIPAQRGVLNIMKAAALHKVKRVVLTSSTSAMLYGKQKHERHALFNENNWTDVNNKKDTTPYFRSKTIAETAAWEFISADKSGLELTTVCPGAILGPVLEEDFGTSANIVIKIMDGSMPALPDLGFDTVDVRSVADLLIRAMEMPEAANERFAGSAGYLKFKDIAQIIKEAYPGKKIPSRTLPDFLVRLFANFDKSLQPVLLDLGIARKVDNEKAKNLLKWNPLPNTEAVIACARSVIGLGLV